MYTSWKNHLVAISTAQPHTDSACSHQVVQEIERRLWPSQSGFHQVALVATYSCIWKWGSIHRQVMALLKDNHDTPLEFDTHMGVGQSWSTWHAGFGWVSGLYVSAAQKRVEYCLLLIPIKKQWQLWININWRCTNGMNKQHKHLLFGAWPGIQHIIQNIITLV